MTYPPTNGNPRPSGLVGTAAADCQAKFYEFTMDGHQIYINFPRNSILFGFQPIWQLQPPMMLFLNLLVNAFFR